jgi:hypothetical protein
VAVLGNRNIFGSNISLNTGYYVTFYPRFFPGPYRRISRRWLYLGQFLPINSSIITLTYDVIESELTTVPLNKS